MPHSTEQKPRKLVLCFDGTGNVFNGNTSDTNIVKLFDKFDRRDPMQYHYYQTGIGTYNVDGGPINKTFLGSIRSKISKTIDSGFATTFDAHVIAGYRFIMRYYKEGDKIYIFGFSRGAFTARFLARMIYRVGLLSEGNEEMVPFAYDLYQDYEKGKLEVPDQERRDSPPTTGSSNGCHETDPLINSGSDMHECSEPDEQQLRKNKLNAFKATFCRSEGVEASGIKVHFLGMFDCVSSVAVLDSPFGKAPKAVSVAGTARHVRHAVAVDEHRVKFKAALLHQDKSHPHTTDEDVKEVWFPGNHGDVGGGWPAAQSATTEKPKDDRSWWRRIFTSWKDPNASNPGTDPYQMSDVPLAWMIRELEIIGEQEPEAAIAWNKRKDGFKKHFFMKRNQAYDGPMHDTLKVSGGSSLFKVILWNFMEYLPIRRWELKLKGSGHEWAYIAWPFNMGSARDIPDGALLHDSLLRRLTTHANYRPSNNRGGKSAACLDPKKFILKDEDTGVVKKSATDIAEPVGIHSIYTLGTDGLNGKGLLRV
ncbi:hypothetical protein COCC4DRAFT_78621 [Bipolaris maydis ATCC 48331]|uniref:T6SS Phospholipase effector Tle1-like catalytic domain-containing protein n=2 Tax=Cochliobolus heterostrophus TaxID=5016 RepID=M2UQR5_COCH5|nr:uncharacterized protein COCC4DRAFT_78621 [Bipolaris maydis ATCC 48331]EMD90242.1 hypothetical protein COCHEDRAFT_1195484 [Bipolaris maydis C5]KAH7555229.1 hypothetical protein BM1_06852 [Bipolaris maydis]ENI09544.1 hypothetical protein COCC4DRAFT_78621 [Bipolaris maydis ATCC 48331]KAJ5023906.1 hypothetical protein J3E73DRAFT_237929 [Bipolaris maydis]KAJ5058140.1 hypothetical protein J3E74DRAFT_476024 [Bipolaris maydis]